MCNFLPLVVFQLTVNICAIRAYIERTVVSNLYSGATVYVPKCHKGFFKYWWDEELGLLKEASVESDRVWKAAGISLATAQLLLRGNLADFLIEKG